MASAPAHAPVLLAESLAILDVRPGGRYVDATVGLGGHSAAIAERMGPDGALLCVDQDSEALAFSRAKLTPFGRRVSFAHGNFRDLARLAAAHGFAAVDGVLLDLGVSSFQLNTAARGFAFGLEGPLDMRMDPSAGDLTAGEIVNTWGEADLADLFFRYGEERQSRRIAAGVVRARPLRTTWDLARAVKQAVGGARGRTHIHPATKVFLALRIRVNGELDSLDAVLPQAHSLLGFGPDRDRGGRLVVISFHSLEDRTVKQYFRREASGCLCPPEAPICRCDHQPSLRELTRRAVRPGEEEIATNPRARSAVLRAAERIH
ncbi:MAG: 16S rRNA (cytosine(1402)-N(4))-methyltransferase RsmH [Dehalococcoidia bacterium]|nr:16S rRNA (cytosine(1402)-N(4))-methyltransferase RsmH [Dehalococcoidia bacterium]